MQLLTKFYSLALLEGQINEERKQLLLSGKCISVLTDRCGDLNTQCLFFSLMCKYTLNVIRNNCEVAGREFKFFS